MTVRGTWLRAEERLVREPRRPYVGGSWRVGTRALITLGTLGAWLLLIGKALPSEPPECVGRALFDPCWIPWSSSNIAAVATLAYLLPLAVGAGLAVWQRFALLYATLVMLLFLVSAIPEIGVLFAFGVVPTTLASLAAMMVTHRGRRPLVVLALSAGVLGASGLGMFVGGTEYAWHDSERVLGPLFFVGITLYVVPFVTALVAVDSKPRALEKSRPNFVPISGDLTQPEDLT